MDEEFPIILGAIEVDDSYKDSCTLYADNVKLPTKYLINYGLTRLLDDLGEAATLLENYGLGKPSSVWTAREILKNAEIK